jgi:hypothetical protein
MSPHTEAVIPELELNKETLQDLGIDGFDAAQVRGGAGEVRMTQSGTSVIQPTQGQTGGTSVIQPTIAQTGTSVIRG